MVSERVRLPLCRCGDYRHHHRGDDCDGPCIFGPSGCDCRAFRCGRWEERDWPWLLPPFAERLATGETRADLALRAVELVRLAMDSQRHRPRLHCCDVCGEHWPCWQEEARQFVEAWEAAN
jgi:hypothetical protein